MNNLVESVWISKKIYDEAEENYYSNLSKAALTPLAGEIAKARQKLIESRDTFNNDLSNSSIDVQAIKFIEKKVVEFEKKLNTILDFMNATEKRLVSLESLCKTAGNDCRPTHQIDVKSAPKTESAPSKNDDDDDVDLFGSESEDDEEAAKVREERLAAYAAKKSKKPTLIAKSNVILDVKPWDDETDMQEMEKRVRKIECDGLLWGAAKLQPLAYGIKKLQISAVVEDEKVSIDWLSEQIEAIEELVQSVDIAAFNKI